MGRTRLARFAAIGLIAALTTGCTSDPEPKEPDSTASATALTPPELPEAATEATSEGASAFVGHYLQMMNFAAHSGDTTQLRELSGPECGSCRRYIEAVDATHNAGGEYLDGDWSAKNLDVSQMDGYWAVTGDVTTAAGRQKDNAESDYRETSMSVTRMEFIVLPDQHGWTLYSFAGVAR
ncbi:DUF6318 family protein [Aeromicrobium sp. Leaf350]|uniref:DUF6318 family protein n=1 Tax=Aeromicrobium sp. Leaf350 TaxID=2876565 RepID=UPI001E3BCCCF|nr:DUF6318 family protein [Aeromicrobium sp. Leaf350]